MGLSFSRGAAPKCLPPPSPWLQACLHPNLKRDTRRVMLVMGMGSQSTIQSLWIILSTSTFLGEKWIDVDHGYYLLLLGRAPQKAHNENRELPRNFILFTCFVHFTFPFFSLFFFSFPPFPLFYFLLPALGGDLPIAPPQIRHWLCCGQFWCFKCWKIRWLPRGADKNNICIMHIVR